MKPCGSKSKKSESWLYEKIIIDYTIKYNDERWSCVYEEYVNDKLKAKQYMRGSNGDFKTYKFEKFDIGEPTGIYYYSN